MNVGLIFAKLENSFEANLGNVEQSIIISYFCF